LSRKATERGSPAVHASMFAAAYIVVWGGFSLLATYAQMQLDGLALLSPMMRSASVPLGAALLIGAGVYQMTPLKHACLRHCRAPIDFFAHRWRRGARGAFSMGLEHGGFCLGCCWVMMGLLFYAGGRREGQPVRRNYPDRLGYCGPRELDLSTVCIGQVLDTHRFRRPDLVGASPGHPYISTIRSRRCPSSTPLVGQRRQYALPRKRGQD
jgi:hypothetical protein